MTTTPPSQESPEWRSFASRAQAKILYHARAQTFSVISEATINGTFVNDVRVRTVFSVSQQHLCLSKGQSDTLLLRDRLAQPTQSRS